MSDMIAPSGMGMHMTKLMFDHVEPLFRTIVEESKTILDEDGADEEDRARHAHASLAVALRMLVRGVYAEVPLLQEGDQEWLILAIHSGVSQAKAGHKFEFGRP